MSSPLESSAQANDSWRSREEILDRFELAWQANGEVAIEKFLPAPGTVGRDELICELIKIDLEYRWQKGQRATLELYFTQFPQLSSSDATVLDLIREEIQVRRYQGLAPAAAELKERFPDRDFDWDALCNAGAPGSIARHDTPHGSSVASTLIPGQALRKALAAPRREAPKCLGRFEIQEVIGKGGFATVYRAWDPELQRDTAIKVPEAPLLIDPSIKTRLLREATSAARLRHPAIVAIHEVSKDENCPFIVYEYIPGPTLAQVMQQTAPSPQQAAQWTAHIAEALDYAHANGIVHRDVKPANIMMGRDGQPLLADFGLAMQTEAACTLTQEGDVLGTPAYMSPEQAGGRNHAVDGRTDVYALGVVLYELLCGRLPFSGSGASVLHRVIHEEPVAPRAVRPNLPVDLETICLRAMSKEPIRRYPSAGAMAEDLQRYLEHRPIKARRLGVVGRTALWCRRQPALAATIALAAAGIALVGGISFAQVVRERDNFRQERDRAEANLYRALAGETRALMKARDTGWWWKAMENIEAAAKLETAPRDLGELRELAIECMGTSYPCFRKQSTLTGLAGPIFSVAVNGDTTQAAASDEKSIRLWALGGGQLESVLPCQDSPATRIAYHPKGRWLISGHRNGELHIWDLGRATGAPGSANGQFSTATASGDGEALAPQKIRLEGGRILSLQVAPDGSWVAAGCADGSIGLLQYDSERAIFGSPRYLRAHQLAVTCLTASLDGDILLSGSDDKTIRLWNRFGGEPIQTMGVPSAPASLTLAPDASFVTWSDNESFGFSMRTLRDNANAGLSQLHTGVVVQVVYDRHDRLLTASFDGTIRLWGNPFGRIQELAVARWEGGRIASMAWSNDRTWVVAGTEEGEVVLWELAEPGERKIGLDTCQSLAFLGDTRRIAKATATWDFSSSMNPPTEHFTPPAVTAVAGHRSKQVYVHGDARGRLYLCSEGGNAQRLATAHHDQIGALASSPDETRFASVGFDGQVAIWDWNQGSKLQSFPTILGKLTGVGWTGDSKRLVILGSRGVALCDLDANQPVQKPLNAGAGAAALGCNEKWIAIGAADGQIRLCDQSGVPVKVLRGHTERISALSFSRDGRHLASAGEDKTLRLWDFESGRELTVREFQGTSPPWLEFQPGGHYLASGSLRNAFTTIWDRNTLLPVASIKDRTHGAGCFLADGRSIILAESLGAVAVCRMADVREQLSVKNAGSRDSAVKWVQVSTALDQGGHVGAVWGVAASPDGNWLATASHDQTVKVWDAKTGALRHTLKGHETICWSVSFSADSRYLAMGAADVTVWEVESGKQVRWFRGHKQLVTGVAFHPKDSWLASSSYDGSLRLWDVATGKSLGKLQQFNAGLYGLAFRQDGAALAVALGDRRVAIWNCSKWGADWLERGRTAERTNPLAAEPDHILTIPGGSVRSVAFDRTGGTLAAGSEQGVVTMWDAATLERRVTLRGGTGQIRCLAFSADGDLLAGAAYAAPTIVWDLRAVRARLNSMNLDW